MSKVTIKAECVVQNNTTNGSNATFVVKNKGKPVPAMLPVQPGNLPVTKAVSVDFNDDSAKQYEPGKQYTITIE